MLREQMQLLASTSRNEDGWVLFSRVADRISEIYSVRARKLLVDARAVDGFEFALRPVRTGAGAAWMYRRRDFGGLS